jgi:hypothetical protein
MHELAVQEILDLPVVVEDMAEPICLDEVLKSYIKDARERKGVKQFTTFSGWHCNGNVDVAIISQLLESLDKAGYVIKKK